MIENVSAAFFISVASVAITFASVVLNVVLNHRSQVRARKPVLAFVDDPQRGCWILQNIGNGPALNVLVAQRARGKWFNPVRAPPFARDSTFAFEWLGRTNVSGLGSSYADFEGRRYTSTLGDEKSRTYDGDRLPRWEESELKRYWELPSQSPVDRWAEKASDFQT